jgi:hypothetical protein
MRIGFSITVVFALALWALFAPGLLSADSVGQYIDAVEHHFHDWHTPLMSIVLAKLLPVGGLDLLMLYQCVAGCAALFAFLGELLELWYPGWPSSRRAGVAMLGFAILLVPPSPLMFWLISFTKDAWCMIFLFALSACAMYLQRRGPTLSRWSYVAAIAVFLGLTELLLLARYNAVVAVPAILWCLWQVLRNRTVSTWLTGAILCSVLPAYFLIFEGMCATFGVLRFHPENQVIALDLVGFFVIDDRYLDEFPYTRSLMNGDGYRTDYVFGDVVPLLFQKDPAIVRNPRDVFFREDDRRNASFRAEYRHAALHHPLTLLKIKWLGFLALIGPFEQTHIVPQDVNDEYLNAIMDTPRTAVLRFDQSVASRLPGWLFASHGPWMIVNLVALLAAVVAWARGRPNARFLLAWLLVPASYYASYLLAAVGRDYRYMYPATVMIQAMLLTLVLGYFLARRKPHPGAIAAGESR